MANKKRSEARGQGSPTGAKASRPTPERPTQNTQNSRERDGSDKVNWVIPSLLAALVIAAVVVYVRMGNRVAPEPQARLESVSTPSPTRAPGRSPEPPHDPPQAPPPVPTPAVPS